MDIAIRKNPIYAYSVALSGACVLVIGILIAGDVFFTQSFALHGDGAPEISKVWMGVFTVLGIGSKKIHDRFQRTTGTAEKAPPLTVSYIFKSILLALFVSPFIIISLYKTLSDIPDEILVYMLCYQNGFFWQTVAGGKEI